jgi:hypothetical protein
MNSVLTKVVATITVLLLLVTAAAFGAPSVRRDSEIATSCQIDCSNEKNRSICGSDGYTYPSECELRKYNCIHNKTISIKHEGSCKNCTEYKLSLKRKNAFPNMTDSEYKQKLINITHEMILQCYPRQNDIKIEKLMMSHLFKPKCGTGSNNHLFKPLQELSLCEKMWCVTHDGDYISDTAVSDQDLDCSARQSCSVNNIIYNDGVTFDGECGSCRCNNGQTNCITDYCGNEGLTNQLVAKLKDDLLQLYMRQYQNGQYITFDLFYLRENNIGEKYCTMLLYILTIRGIVIYSYFITFYSN